MDNAAEVLPSTPPKNTPLKNLRHEIFCNEYLKDFNATQAALRADYAKSGAKQEGHRLLTRVDVQARLSELTAERFSRVKIDADYVLKKAHHIVERCLQEVEPVMAHGIHVKDKTSGRPLYTFQAQTAVKALEIMGKHVDVGAFTPDVNIENGTINVLIGGGRCTCGRCTCRPAGRQIVAGAVPKERVLDAETRST